MKVDLIVVDDIDLFTRNISGEWTLNVVDQPGAKDPIFILNAGPFKDTEVREDSKIGPNMVAIYEKHHDGYGQIKRWNYATKEGK